MPNYPSSRRCYRWRWLARLARKLDARREHRAALSLSRRSTTTVYPFSRN